MGDSMVVTGDDSVIKVHIHVHDPGVPLSYAVQHGVISDVVVENMQEQSESYISARLDADPEVEVRPGQPAVVAVVPGDGLRRVFRSMGAATVISGGQTMNPSSGEFLEAIEKLNTDQIVILPNNKNIILTAEQVAKEAPDKQIRVIPTRSVPQGIASMLAFNGDNDLDTVTEQMTGAREGVITGELTTSTRTVEIDGVSVREGQLLGLVDGAVKVASDTMDEGIQQLLAAMGTDQHELITVYYGQDVAPAEATRTADLIRALYPNQEIEVISGGQPHYFYIVSVE